MARSDVLLTCHTSNGKRYLNKDGFYELSKIDRTEAILWLVWPWSLRFTVLCRLAGIGHGSGRHLGILERENRAARANDRRGYWRFKPSK